MFDFLKRRSVTPTPPPKRAAAKSRQVVDPLSPLPLPEVKEGNQDSDWSRWEDSVAFQDSHIHSEYPETQPTPLPAVTEPEDPFAKVRQREP